MADFDYLEEWEEESPATKAPKQDSYSKPNQVNGINNWLNANVKVPKNTKWITGVQSIIDAYAAHIHASRKDAYKQASKNFEAFKKWAKETFPFK